MPRLPTTPASFKAPVAASQARSKAQDIVDANRSKAEKLFNGRQAKKNLIRLLARADRELSAQLDEMKRRGPAYRPWTQADTEATLAIVREQLGVMAPGFKALLNANAERARELGAKGTVQLLEHFEQTMPGTIRPLSIEGASQLLSGTVLSRHASSVARYGAMTIASIQRELAVGALINRTFDEMATRLQREQPLLSRRYFAERVVRTECMSAYNAGHLDEIAAQRAGNFPDLEKKLIETFDKRTGQDSYKAHGQIRKPEEMFVDGNGRQYLHPPGRPNDRGVVVPWRREWSRKNRSKTDLLDAPEVQPVQAPVVPVADQKPEPFLVPVIAPPKQAPIAPDTVRVALSKSKKADAEKSREMATLYAKHKNDLEALRVADTILNQINPSDIRMTQESVPKALVDKYLNAMRSGTVNGLPKPLFVSSNAEKFPLGDESHAYLTALGQHYKDIGKNLPLIEGRVHSDARIKSLIAMHNERATTMQAFGSRLHDGFEKGDMGLVRDEVRRQLSFAGKNMSNDIINPSADRLRSIAIVPLPGNAGALHSTTSGQIGTSQKAFDALKSGCKRLADGASFEELSATDRWAITMLFHEESHGFSPQSGGAYKGIGVHFEEVGTELLARRAIRRLMGPNDSVVATIKQPEWETDVKMYSRYSLAAYPKKIGSFLDALRASACPSDDLVTRVEDAFIRIRTGTIQQPPRSIKTPAEYFDAFINNLGDDIPAGRRELIRQKLMQRIDKVEN